MIDDQTFVNREHAEAEAARAIRLLNDSDESKVEAWFAMQAVANEVGTGSNVGIRGVSWTPGRAGGGRRWGPTYHFYGSCVNGYLNAAVAAPSTLEEARQPKFLDTAKATLERKIAEMGGLSEKQVRPPGTADALISAVQASPEGKEWLAARQPKSARLALGKMVRVADLYGREGVCPAASLDAHYRLAQFDNRVKLVREFPTTTEANAKAMSLRHGTDDDLSVRRVEVPSRLVTRLRRDAGVSRSEATAILRAVMHGRSKRQLVRAVNLATELVAKPSEVSSFRGVRRAA